MYMATEEDNEKPQCFTEAVVRNEALPQEPEDNEGDPKRYRLRHGSQPTLKSCPISSTMSHVTSTEEMVGAVQYLIVP